MKNILSGRKAEDDALRYLEQQQLKLIERNYATPYGEIDLIMQDQDSTVFVEVRKRSNSNYASAVESVDYRKQKRLTRTAYNWIQQKHYEGDCRFDIVAINGSGELDWIRNAFEASDI